MECLGGAILGGGGDFGGAFADDANTFPPSLSLPLSLPISLPLADWDGTELGTGECGGGVPNSSYCPMSQSGSESDGVIRDRNRPIFD